MEVVLELSLIVTPVFPNRLVAFSTILYNEADDSTTEFAGLSLFLSDNIDLNCCKTLYLFA